MNGTDLTPEQAANEGLYDDCDLYDGDQEVPLDPTRMARLQSMHTRQLIWLLRANYCRSGWWERYEADNYNEPTIAEIKAVLRTREHIPNKVEARKIRKERAKTSKDARNNRCIMRCR